MQLQHGPIQWVVVKAANVYGRIRGNCSRYFLLNEWTHLRWHELRWQLRLALTVEANPVENSEWSGTGHVCRPRTIGLEAKIMVEIMIIIISKLIRTTTTAITNSPTWFPQAGLMAMFNKWSAFVINSSSSVSPATQVVNMECSSPRLGTCTGHLGSTGTPKALRDVLNWTNGWNNPKRSRLWDKAVSSVEALTFS